MKSHLIIKLRKGCKNRFPHWRDIVHESSMIFPSLLPEIDEIIDKFKLPLKVCSEYVPAGSIWNKEEMAGGFDRIYRLILTKNTNIPPQLIKEISLLKNVEKVYKGVVGTTNSPIVTSLSGKTTHSTYAHSQIHLPEAHNYTLGHASVVIAVLDAGVKTSHPELQDCLINGYDFVDIIDGAGEFFGDHTDADNDPDENLVGHGTHVSGIIAAKGKFMPLGIAPKCKIMPLKVLGAMKRGNGYVGAGLIDNINNAIKYAIDNGADIINMSLGIKHEGGGLPHEEVVEYAKQKDVTIVAASGNDGSNQLYYPGALDHVIAVGATNEQGIVSPFTTYGKVTLVAPGTNIYSSYTNNGYAFASGTSQAAPMVAGAIALLKSHAKRYDVTLSDKQVKYLLKHTSDKPGRSFKARKSGFGKLNIIDAIKLLNYKLNK